jgi:hypothetical protein
MAQAEEGTHAEKSHPTCLGTPAAALAAASAFHPATPVLLNVGIGLGAARRARRRLLRL